MKLLVNIQSPEIAARARKEGYTADEHREGWRLWKLAAGEGRSLDHWQLASQPERAPAASPSLGLLQELDAFENTWFPRTRAIIRRVVPKAHRDAFLATFFHDLTQQPLGPAVVGSVRTFLQRFDALSSSTLPAAREVRATLVARGLDKARVARVRVLLAQLEEAPSAPSSATPARPEDVAAAEAAQREALEQLGDWFNDWATTLRPVYNPAVQAQLGLGTVRRASAQDDKGDDEDDDGADDGEDPPDDGPET